MARRITGACGHLPLATRIAGATLAADPRLSLPRFAELLADQGRCLDELAIGDQSVRARLAAGVSALSVPARRALVLLARDGTHDAAGAVDPQQPGEADPGVGLAALADAGLLARAPCPGQHHPSHQLHPLVAAFAADLGPLGQAPGHPDGTDPPASPAPPGARKSRAGSSS